jgi:2-polyprenyl-6-methoxyphenol hydroxylase-like FAD-dependent oxidoreductase
MSRVVVVGAGLGGLAGAVFLARRGHEVVVLERDEQSPSGVAEQDFGGWRRPGVPQARLPHRFLGLACKVLTDEAPDVIEQLLARGVLRADLSVGGRGADPDDDVFTMCARRLVYESVVRHMAEHEHHVQILAGVAADGLTVRVDDAIPIVVGVRTGAGEVVDADVVVDSTGRRSPVPRWFGEIGLDAPPTTTQECGFQYFSRFYRLRDGTTFPTTEWPISARLDYVTALAFPGDNRTFSLALALFVEDPCRRALREPATFDRVLSAFDVTAPWIDVGKPITEVHTMARIENRWRRLVDETGRPLVGGLVLVGDSSMHTNPTFGRGVSLAFAQAQRIAATLGDASEDPAGYVAQFEKWTAQHLRAWFDSQVAGDAAQLERFTAALRGEEPAPSTDPGNRFFGALFALAPHDDVVARCLARLSNLLVTPAELSKDADLTARVTNYLDTHDVIGTKSQGPTRAEFVQLVA